jgi:PPP family 3-phenylpropionic acid transporter
MVPTLRLYTAIVCGLLHLTCLRLLAESVPHHLVPTALTIYGTVGIGVPTALLTLASGQLYAHFGAHGFWVMAAFCAAALPVARTMRQSAGYPS